MYKQIETYCRPLVSKFVLLSHSKAKMACDQVLSPWRAGFQTRKYICGSIVVNNDCWVGKTSGKHKLPSPADHVKYLPHSEECAMQKYGIIVLDELLLCAAFFSYFLRKLRETMTQGYRAPIVAESRKQGKKTEPSLWNIQGVAVITMSQKYFLICYQDWLIPFSSSFNIFQMFIQ